jgi:hypothetical protein
MKRIILRINPDKYMILARERNLFYFNFLNYLIKI